MPNMTQKFSSDPLGFLRDEVDYWGSKVSQPLGGSGFNRSQEMGLPDQYNLTPQDHESAFLETNPQMRPEYMQQQPGWTQRLMRRLAQAGQVQQNAMPQGQPMPQMGGGGMDPMQARGAALQNSYNQGRQLGQIGRMFGG